MSKELVEEDHLGCCLCSWDRRGGILLLRVWLHVRPWLIWLLQLLLARVYRLRLLLHRRGSRGAPSLRLGLLLHHRLRHRGGRRRLLGRSLLRRVRVLLELPDHVIDVPPHLQGTQLLLQHSPCPQVA